MSVHVKFKFYQVISGVHVKFRFYQVFRGVGGGSGHDRMVA